jgi:DNA-binding LytR/AlgR family response regulator
MTPRALIADDEPVLRDILEARLAKAWPELQIVAKARNGREAVELFERLRPDICFLDVHMPGMSGLEAARLIGPQAQMVFVTAYDKYALEAFEHGVLDYLVKPVTDVRLATTVERLKQRMEEPRSSAPSDDLLREVARRLDRIEGVATTGHLRWLRASKGGGLHLIPVQVVDYLRADSKYTSVGYRDDAGRPAEALIRLALKELVSQLDPGMFVQIHRSVVVNLSSIRRVVRLDRDSAEIELKHREERLPVSKTYLHLFREM